MQWQRIIFAIDKSIHEFLVGKKNSSVFQEYMTKVLGVGKTII